MSARIKVELDDGTGTWVTVIPLRQMNHLGAVLAAGEATAMFVASLSREAVVLDEHLHAVEHHELTPLDRRRLEHMLDTEPEATPKSSAFGLDAGVSGPEGDT